MLEHVGIQPSPPLIHWDNSLSGSNKVFHLKIALKLVLFEYWLLLARCCPVSTFSYLRGKAFLGKPAKITFVERNDVHSWIKFGW